MGCIPDHPLLKRDLKSLESFIEPNTGKLAIESKRGKGKKSTDYSDALSYTFAIDPERSDANYSIFEPIEMISYGDMDIFDDYRLKGNQKW